MLCRLSKHNGAWTGLAPVPPIQTTQPVVALVGRSVHPFLLTACSSGPLKHPEKMSVFQPGRSMGWGKSTRLDGGHCHHSWAAWAAGGEAVIRPGKIRFSSPLGRISMAGYHQGTTVGVCSKVGGVPSSPSNPFLSPSLLYAPLPIALSSPAA